MREGVSVGAAYPRSVPPAAARDGSSCHWSEAAPSPTDHRGSYPGADSDVAADAAAVAAELATELAAEEAEPKSKPSVVDVGTEGATPTKRVVFNSASPPKSVAATASGADIADLGGILSAQLQVAETQAQAEVAAWAEVASKGEMCAPSRGRRPRAQRYRPPQRKARGRRGT